MKKDNLSITETEKYEARLNELQELIKQIEATIQEKEKTLDSIRSNREMIENIYQGLDQKDKIFASFLEFANVQKEKEKKVRQYKSIVQSASLFTAGILISVVANIVTEQFLEKSIPIIVIVLIIGLGILLSFGYKTWLDYSAQKSLDVTKRIFREIEKKT